MGGDRFIPSDYTDYSKEGFEESTPLCPLCGTRIRTRIVETIGALAPATFTLVVECIPCGAGSYFEFSRLLLGGGVSAREGFRVMKEIVERETRKLLEEIVVARVVRFKRGEEEKGEILKTNGGRGVDV